MICTKYGVYAQSSVPQPEFTVEYYIEPSSVLEVREIFQQFHLVDDVSSPEYILGIMLRTLIFCVIISNTDTDAADCKI